jgi:hypothetical protein
MHLKGHTSLNARIPDDVRARLDKAGVDDVEWYAGRLDNGGVTFVEVSEQRKHDLKRQVAARREQAAAERPSLVSRIVSRVRSRRGVAVPR